MKVVLLCLALLAASAQIALCNEVLPEQDSNKTTPDGHHAKEHSEEEPPFMTIEWERVRIFYVLSAWILIAALSQIVFHHYPRLLSYFPESFLLLVIGLLVGLFLKATTVDASEWTFEPNAFFLIMLPPLILEAGFFMPKKAFFNNLPTILVYAVIGTLFNAFCIGGTVWGLHALVPEIYFMHIGVTKNLTLVHTLAFSSLISAVDPVAVLAVFAEVSVNVDGVINDTQQIQVNTMLYIIIFGESLLNDAVTVVLYKKFSEFAEVERIRELTVQDGLLAVASFFIVGLGGTFIGLVFGLATAFITRFTEGLRVVEPIIIFCMSYLSYLTAETFELSGIMSITFCGIMMKSYVAANVTTKSLTSIKCFLKMTARISETIIFMFIGTSAVNFKHEWDITFISVVLVSCTIYRVLGVIILTAIVNIYREKKISRVEQFTMAYGGLRGGIAFCLAISLPADLFPERSVMVSSAIVVVIFTVIVQGATIKPVVRLLRVRRETKEQLTMAQECYIRSIDNLMSGMSAIVKFNAETTARRYYQALDEKVFKRLTLRNPQNDRLLRSFERINYTQAMSLLRAQGQGTVSADCFRTQAEREERARNLVPAPKTSKWDLVRTRMVPSASSVNLAWNRVLADLMPDKFQKWLGPLPREVLVDKYSLDDDDDAAEILRNPKARQFIAKLLEMQESELRRSFEKKISSKPLETRPSNSGSTTSLRQRILKASATKLKDQLEEGQVNIAFSLNEDDNAGDGLATDVAGFADSTYL